MYAATAPAASAERTALRLLCLWRARAPRPSHPLLTLTPCALAPFAASTGLEDTPDETGLCAAHCALESKPVAVLVSAAAAARAARTLATRTPVMLNPPRASLTQMTISLSSC